MDLLLIQSCLVVLFAAIVQSTTGFAFGIILMMFFPMFFSVPESMWLVNFINLITVCSITFQHRRHINYKLVWLPLLLSIAGNYIGMANMIGFDRELGIKIVGTALICLAIYFLFFSKKVKVEANQWTAAGSGIVSGLMGGFFNMPGPAMVLYYSVAIKEKEEYIATIQFLFMFSTIYRVSFLTSRISPTPTMYHLLPYTFAAAIIGILLGHKIFKKMSGVWIQKGVYSLMVLFGIYYMIR